MNIQNKFDTPYTISDEFVENFLADKPTVSHKMIASKPMIGMINGMYASSNYLGGITIIQVINT